MPYRRLPTTDLARQRAMRRALQIAIEGKLKPSLHAQTVASLEVFSQKFDQALQQMRADKKMRTRRHRELNVLEEKAKMYILHFMQVVSMAVDRDEMKPDIMTFYGIDYSSGKLPLLRSEQETLEWGEKVLSGEQKRIAAGGSPVYNPSIAVVKVVFNEFRDAYINFRNYRETVSRTSERFIQLRKQCNDLIAQVWDEVEKNFEDLPSKHKRQKAQEYGVIYVFRRKEKKKLTGSDLQADLLFE
jgi:hypothetical protein